MTANSNGYYEYLPEGYNPAGTQKYPVILFLHGAGDVGNGSAAELPRLLLVGIPKLINEGNFPVSFTVNGVVSKFIVISPQFISLVNDVPGEAAAVTDVHNILNYIGQNYKVDLNRVYLTGLSMGGGSTFNYPGSSPDNANRLAAIVPIANASYPVAARAQVIAAANLPVWATHNNGDPSVPVTQTSTYITLINQPPIPATPAKETIFISTVHDAWTATYDPNFKENGLNIYEWMLQYQRPIVALPVLLATYKAAKSGAGQITVSWSTASEQNNKHFTLERSANGIDFTSIAIIPGSNRANDYTYVDKAPLRGNNYYRLSQTDRDGSVTYFKILQVQPGEVLNTGLHFYPNPAKDQITLSFANSERGEFIVSIISMNGAVAKKVKFDKQSDVQEKILLLHELAPGKYILQVKGESYTDSKTFLKN
ncbi:MAG TPA: T9SS type A sorting domain-containing protein [Flavisolibacter sp.]|nr:T9SS type A sorting domain-containing protein [Flavisolibacter sp.]